MFENCECNHFEMRCLRVITATFTGMFMIFSVALITIGILCKSLWSDYLLILESTMRSVPVILIVLGFIFIGVTIVGLFGTIMKNWILLVVYSGLVALIIFVEVGAAITCGVFQTQLNFTVKLGMKNVMSNNTMVMDSVQNKFSCCGINGYQDYNSTLPSSCCPTTNTCTSAYAANTGCLPVFVSVSSGNLGLAIGLIIAAIIFETISIIVVARLYNLLKQSLKPPPE